MDCSVTFFPGGGKITVGRGTLISEAAAMAGITALHLPCGGRGTCGKCLVSVHPAAIAADPVQPAAASGRLVSACTTRIESDITVVIERRNIGSASCIVADTSAEMIACKNAKHSPVCEKIAVHTRPPSIDDNYADFELIESALGERTGLARLSCSRALLQTVAKTLRTCSGTITATVFSDNGLRELVALEPGDTTASHYGIACDIGTTTVSLRLIDCSSGKTCGVASDYNGQISRGSDIISRIEYGRSPERREELRMLALATLNRLIETVCGNTRVDRRTISAASFAGNSAMVHLFLGLDARYLREHPYVPTVKHVPALRAAECGLALNPDAKVIFSPGVGSYVGGDITAGLLCTDMISSPDGFSLFIDIGTNGEIVIGNSEFLLTAACSAGPAFEGSGISCGMRASPEAIDSFDIGPACASVDWTVIGDTKPAGICGSGLISLLGELLNAGLIDRSGKFTGSVPPERDVRSEGTKGFLLVKSPDTAHGRDIIITESDIDNLIRTKAAIYAACDCMLAKAGLDFLKISRFLIAGGFGRFINITDAVRIGLFPELPASRFLYLGNTSLAGATLALLSEDCRKILRDLPGRMTYLELSNDRRYLDSYTAALFLPHTDMKRFGIGRT